MHSVEEIQRRLLDLGFGPLVVDSDYGPITKRAVRRFQQARGLFDDGIVGPQTEAALWPVMTQEQPQAVGLITGARVKAFAPSALPSILDAFDYHQADIRDAGLTTPLRAQQFMAQVAIESGGLVKLDENLNYTAKRLTQVWPKRFPTLASAQPYANNPQRLANKVYGGRLGNTEIDDGWRYRGSGLMQVTGRSNFRAAGYEDNPEALRTAGPALTSALKFWSDYGCNAAADADDLERVRRIVNGGLNGIDDARVWLTKAKRIFV